MSKSMPNIVLMGIDSLRADRRFSDLLHRMKLSSHR